MSIRVRFAPSPTGFLHIGGARTALFNWLFARAHDGVFVLRIEDTDEARNTPEAIQALIDGLRWLGLDWDEGPTTPNPYAPSQGDRGPYFQSQRGAIYQRHIEALLQKDLAYERDGAIRFRMPTEPIVIPDRIIGDVQRELTDREREDPDFVIVRSDGKPVFHLVNVIDDLEMGITHVLRGEDHLSNTSRHIALYHALGAAAPEFAHIPLILNANGSKMSKRDAGASMTKYIDEGYIPEAVANYLALLGWAPGDNREIFKLKELVTAFSLDRVNRANAKFDATKMTWVNERHVREVSPETLVQGCAPFLIHAGLDIDTFSPEYTQRAIESCREKLKTFRDILDFATFYFTDEFEYDPGTAEKRLTPDSIEILQSLRTAYESTPDTFTESDVESATQSVADAAGLKIGKLNPLIRLTMTGAKGGPSLFPLIEILGKQRAIARIDRAIAFCEAQ